MSERKDVTSEILPHTEAKHKILRNYLHAWFPILSSSSQRVLYIDGFAGPGEYYKRSPNGSVETVDGSPIIALKAARDHLHSDKWQRTELVFLFIEKDNQCIANLERKVSEIKHTLPRNFRIEPDPLTPFTFEGALNKVLFEIEAQNKPLAPSFVFIDPFGLTGFPLDLLKRLAQQPKSEVLINFNYQAIARWFLPNPQKHGLMDELYGSDIWRQALEIPDPHRKEECLRKTYQEVLQGLGWQGVRPFRMENKQNGTQYYLFFATSHGQGMLAMKRVMWRLSPIGNFQYSDLTDPQQPRLFKKKDYDPDFSKDLANQLYQNHCGQTISKELLLQGDLAWHPICIDRHLTQALKILEKKAKISDVRLPDGKNRRNRTYPEGCTITFAP